MAKPSLRECFRDFFVEVQRQKAAVQQGHHGAPVDSAGREAGASRSADVGAVRGPHPAWEAILTVLQRQARAFEGRDAVLQRCAQEAQYAMTALADQVFIVDLGNWAARQAWTDFPLEKALYKTQIAGEEVFRRIDTLLERGDPSTRELAEIYFNVLSLGFLGRYGIGQARAGGFAPPEIEDYRRRLHYFFTGGSQPMPGRVSETAYEHIETMDLGGKLPSVVQSLTLFAIVAVLLFVATLVTRYTLTRDIETHLREVRAAHGTPATAPANEER